MQGLDTSQAESVFHLALRKGRPAAEDPTPEQWNALIDRQVTELALTREMPEAEFERLTRLLEAARDRTPPDAQTFQALSDMGMRAQKAQAALRRQTASAAAMNGVTPTEAAERVAAYREQYQRDYARLPAAERPDPPADWVKGYTKKDMMAVSSPQDRATLYAMYRVQADPEAFGGRRKVRFASTDLETAGPEGKSGFKPENGSIIEVGVVEYDQDGKHVGTYGQLVQPADDVAASCGTGAVAIHGITMADVEGKPSWEQVAPEVTKHLAGRTMITQHYPFERDWLGHHMPAAGQQFDKWKPSVDTLTLSRQHMSSLPNHKLKTICEAVGVDYTEGHRSVHDSEVTAQAFFKMRDNIHATWKANPARANAPQPPAGAGASRASQSKITRLNAADFNPAKVVDAWTSKPVRGVA